CEAWDNSLSGLVF
nr:immunoglobulin light chain junction region [Macaca mulatta]